MEINTNSSENTTIRRSRSWSLYAAVFFSLAVVIARIAVPPVNMLTWDVFGYYLYLPANFIYDDPALSNHQWVDEIMQKYQPSPTLYQLVDLDEGKRLIKYSSGLALIYSPFFFAAHALAPALGYPADGFSLPYNIALSIGGILWAIAGIFLLRKVLLRFFDDRLSAVVMALIIAGTNYFHIVAIDGTLITHNYLFTLYALLVLLTVKWHEKPTARYAAGIGLTIGLTGLIRPSEAICLLIPLLWNTGTAEAFRDKLKKIKHHPWHLLLIAITAFLVGAIQFFYWKELTGQWIYYSYSNNPGEGFRFFPPYIIEFLFSYRKGWLLYTPLMIFAFAGMALMLRKKYRAALPALVVFMLLDLWIISAWTAWWYGGGSFSSRSIIPAYVLLAIPIGYVTKELIATKLRPVAGIVAVLLIALNLFQSWQWQARIIDKERMTGEYYWAVFAKTQVDKQKLDHLLMVDRGVETNETPAHMERYSGKLLWELPARENSRDTFYISSSGQPSESTVQTGYRMHKVNAFSPGINKKFSELTAQDHVWIKSTVEIFVPDEFQGKPPMLVNTFHYNGDAYKYRAVTLKPNEIKYGEWNYLEYWYLTPEVRTTDDNLKSYVWYSNSDTAYIRNFRIHVFEIKEH